MTVFSECVTNNHDDHMVMHDSVHHNDEYKNADYDADLDTVGTLLSGGLGPLLGHVEVALDHGGQAGHVGALAHVPVLEQTLLGHVRLLQIHAEFQVAEHDLLDQLLAVRVVTLLGLDNIVERVQGSGWFS